MAEYVPSLRSKAVGCCSTKRGFRYTTLFTSGHQSGRIQLSVLSIYHPLYVRLLLTPTYRDDTLVFCVQSAVQDPLGGRCVMLPAKEA